MFVASVLRRFKVFSLCFAWIIAFAAQAHAISVVPISAELSDSGEKSKITIRVTNDGALPTPVEIIASKVKLAEDGKITATPAKEKFLIFPPQATLAPGASQSFRVQWLGGPNLKTTETYSLAINQLPIVMDKKKSGVQIVFSFDTVINVSPANVKPEITVLKAEIGNVPKMGNAPAIPRAPTITVENTGNGHALLGEASVALTDGKWTKALSKDEVRKLFGIGLVQPRSKRRFVVAMPLPPEVSTYQVQIDLNPPSSAR